MNRIGKFVVEHARLASALALAMIVGIALLAGEVVRYRLEQERLSVLQTEAQRRSVELMSQTLNGIMMGAMSILGLSDPDIKSEAAGQLAPNSPRLAALIESVGRSYEAEGMFVVGENGVITSAWDSGGRNSTGLDVKFRPYFLMAMQGIENVYAAISLTTGKRAVYFSAPVFSGTTKASAAVGAVVIRSSLAKVDLLLKTDSEITLLLSPQGVVFASTDEEWIGRLAGTPTADRIKAIRDLKQFGNLFDKQDIMELPFPVAPGIVQYDQRRYAMETAKVSWNDPYGDWTLVVMEDLSRTVPAAGRLQVSAAVGGIAFLLAWMLLHLLRGHHGQTVAAAQLAAYSREQQASAERKSLLAGAALRMQQATRPDELVSTYFTESNRMFGSLQGALYLFDPGSTTTLHLAGRYACAGELPATLTAGEGLLGQCVLDRRVDIVDTAPGGFATIRSGLGETRPAAVMMAPVLLNEALLGVVELALLTHPGDAERAQFEELTGLLAMDLEILGRSVHTEKAQSAAMAGDQARLALTDEAERWP
ncbi:MAG: C4-dicarboxylate transporter [Proteobacteria bacterium]|nr:C4-dicarboxylate transporter [Pseudomonadota bacterium]